MQPLLDDNAPELEELRVDLHELAARWEVPSPPPRPDLATPRSQGWRTRRIFTAQWLPRLAATAVVLAVIAGAFVAVKWLQPPADIVDEPVLSRFIERLDWISDDMIDDDGFAVTFGDIQATMEMAELTRPVAGDDESAFAVALTGGNSDTTTGPMVPMTGPSGGSLDLPVWMGDAPAVREEIGWALPDADTFVFVSRPEPLGMPVDVNAGTSLVVDGPAAAAEQPQAIPDESLLRFGADGQSCSLQDSTRARTQGCPLWTTTDSDSRLTTSTRSVAQQWPDGGAGLANDARVLAMADALSTRATGTATSVIYAQDDFTLPPDLPPDVAANSMTLPAAFEQVLVALVVDDDGTRSIVAVYDHESGEAARTNHAAMSDVWSNLASMDRGFGGAKVEDVTSIQDDTMVVVQGAPATTADATQLLNGITEAASPFVHAS